MKYSLLPSVDDDHPSPQLREQRYSSPWTFLWQRVILNPAVPWTLCIIFSSVALIFGLIDHEQSKLGTFAAGYATDFVTARPYIKVSHTTFTGSPAFDDQGNLFVPNPDPVRYVGDPAQHPEIDYNWDNLTWGRYVLVTKEEAAASWGESDLDRYWDSQRGGYVAGFDMFHTLHCLNNLRKALNPAYYESKSKSHRRDSNDDLHQDHCIEQIRQYIMCSGDMTPVPTTFYPSFGRNYVLSDVAHTCRDIEPLRRWMVDRYDGPTAVEPLIRSE